jgi:hypothetical protein
MPGRTARAPLAAQQGEYHFVTPLPAHTRRFPVRALVPEAQSLQQPRGCLVAGVDVRENAPRIEVVEAERDHRLDRLGTEPRAPPMTVQAIAKRVLRSIGMCKVQSATADDLAARDLHDGEVEMSTRQFQRLEDDAREKLTRLCRGIRSERRKSRDQRIGRIGVDRLKIGRDEIPKPQSARRDHGFMDQRR